MASQHPQIGTWYEDRVFDTIFEVVAVDDRAGTIELQYANGDIDEMELEQWADRLFPVATPPNASDDLLEDTDEYDSVDPPLSRFPFRQADSCDFSYYPGADDNWP